MTLQLLPPSIEAIYLKLTLAQDLHVYTQLIAAEACRLQRLADFRTVYGDDSSVARETPLVVLPPQEPER